MLRKIGHELLLQAGDSTSRVLPVQKIAENEYQIKFENELTFQPDSLMNTTQRLLANEPQASDYIVNVLTCNRPGVFYAFAVSKNKSNSIVTCSKRKQPTACYIVNIKFKPASVYTTKSGYLWGGLPLLAFVGFIFFRSANPRKSSIITQQNTKFKLGAVIFDTLERHLKVNENIIDLTGTETRLLLIFASTPNETITRSRLQKEIWEDEGIIVGRSLDMFISKLRKKLECDPNINIVVVRGKGYKLDISA
ncbi:winged helix-turn-helix domain-containing protein [Mucilaginibacter antarcticus]|uniref:winged helix-turn-helix domain-containing protein n=1 Tax=Mucilaginibacter antarcticus TaxID=1855725 RepID=UPI0036439990